MTDKTPRRKMLEHAADLIDGDRDEHYGSPTKNFDNIARLWNIRFQEILGDGKEFTASDIADAMILMKIARTITKKTEDTYTDIAGYAACGHEIEFPAPPAAPASPTRINMVVHVPQDVKTTTELAREIQARLDKTYGRGGRR